MYSMQPLMRLVYGPKSCAISAQLISSPFLNYAFVTQSGRMDRRLKYQVISSSFLNDISCLLFTVALDIKIMGFFINDFEKFTPGSSGNCRNLMYSAPDTCLSNYTDPAISQNLLEKIQNTSFRKIRLMEVCGTHTVSILKNGIKGLLPKSVSLISGPGCPVCVTSTHEIDSFITLARQENVILTAFGDLARVPGTNSSLSEEGANGFDIRYIYSPADALDIAKKNPEKKVVFAGVGFETTAPLVASTIFLAEKLKIDNYYVFSAHKLMPPALFALMNMGKTKIDGFLLPGHVSAIIGEQAYIPFFNQYHIPSIISGFEPVDILQGISALVKQIESGTPMLENGYSRIVSFNGNRWAQKIMHQVFETTDALWRGLGMISGSGLGIKNEFAHRDAVKNFLLKIEKTEIKNGCICGEIITGVKTPEDCPLYKNTCTPLHPVGPCMVSGEGTCGAYFRYHGNC